MSHSIFDSIKVPGSQPSDANWPLACWGYHTIDEAFDGVFGNADDWLHDGNDELCVEGILKCENDKLCILNGEKNKLLFDKIIYKTKKSECDLLADENDDKICSAAHAARRVHAESRRTG